ncbi:unnamed protein product [Somion occarium]|uniref:Uncharacterized protein n=1 Tax=Somion occarium TaxID=3059160 RepID=A0ABP1CX52_9APHY
MLILYHHDPGGVGDKFGLYKTLRSWALTCKALLPRCRYNLYRSVMLWGKQHEKFLRTLENNPYLASYIRALHLFGDILSRPPSILIYLAGKLPNVRVLQLIICPEIFTHQYLHKALSSFSTITMLILLVRLGIFDIQRLLHTLSNLQYLELLEPPIILPGSNPHCRICCPPRCRLTSFVASLRFETTLIRTSMGDRTIVKPPNPDWFALYRALLRTPEFISTMKRFYIEVISWEGRTETNELDSKKTWLTHLISLRDNTNLRRLGLFLDSTFDEEVTGLVPLLSTISSSVLQEIVLFGWDGFKQVQSSTWTLLDEALCDSRFDALTSIHVIEDVEDQNPVPAVERLPRCASRGLISSSYISSATGSFSHRWVNWAPEYERMLFEV